MPYAVYRLATDPETGEPSRRLAGVYPADDPVEDVAHAVALAFPGNTFGDPPAFALEKVDGHQAELLRESLRRAVERRASPLVPALAGA